VHSVGKFISTIKRVCKHFVSFNIGIGCPEELEALITLGMGTLGRARAILFYWECNGNDWS